MSKKRKHNPHTEPDATAVATTPRERQRQPDRDERPGRRHSTRRRNHQTTPHQRYGIIDRHALSDGVTQRVADHTCAAGTRQTRTKGLLKATLVLTLLCLTTLGCDTRFGKAITKATRATGITDPPPPPAVTLDAVCDATPGSSCNEKNLSATLDVVLPWIAVRPYSSLRLWTLGEDLETTKIIAERTSTPPVKPSTRARQAHEAQFAREARAFLLQANQPFFGRAARRSPIAEALAKVGLTTTTPSQERTVIYIGDMREYSRFGNFECGHLPQPEDFVRSLRAANVLTPGSLHNVRVIFCFAGIEAVAGERCTVSIDRYTRMTSLWQAAITHAGASFELFTGGIPSLERLSTNTERR